jgi:glycosyltransferase involved in cell wall biosynthesis
VKLLYVSNARLPTRFAHGLQIMQNCEAFAAAGADVTLWVPRRAAGRDSDHGDPFVYYGIERTFRLRRLLCLDLTPVFRVDSLPWKIAFYVEVFSFALAALIALLFTRTDRVYSRDPQVLLLLTLIRPRAQVVYEAHNVNQTRAGLWLQRRILRRSAYTVAITPPLAAALDAMQPASPAPSALMVAHDGIRAARFESPPPRDAARDARGWPRDLFVVGYLGKLQTYGMEKGVGALVDAFAHLTDRPGIALALVGGPDDVAAGYRDQWAALGLADSRLLVHGHVSAADVPRCLAAFDVCVMPLPFKTHFAYYASPLKLFEYMASGRAIIASDLPAYADVITHDEHALLIPPGDVDALAGAITRLHADPALCARLGDSARDRVFDAYTWDVRARRILDFIA